MRILYIFIDGIGFGKADTAINPFASYARSSLKVLSDPGNNPEPAWHMSFLDAHQGLSGLPQSATGQTSLWTGINGSAVMGHHKTGFPGPSLIKYINEYSIVKQFVDHGYRASLINAYSDRYIERIEHQPRFRSASTLIQQASKQSLKSLSDLKKGQALYMDLTFEMMHRLFPEYQQEFPIQSAQTSARHALQILAGNDLLLYEFFLTDKAGHKQDWEMGQWAIQTLEEFLDTIKQNLDPENELLIVSSDHGNLEDLSVKTHTHNDIPALFYGKKAEFFQANCKTLIDIPLCIYQCFDWFSTLLEEINQVNQGLLQNQSV